MENMNDEKSFAQLLAESETEAGAEVRPGDRITGRIISIGRDQVYVSTGTKVDGVVDREELLDEKGQLPYSEGDQIELFVVAQSQGEIKLGLSFGTQGGVEQLIQAMEQGIPVQGKVKETCKGGYRVQVMGTKPAFCPLSQMDIRPVEDPGSLIGQTFLFLINRIEEKGRNIVVSRRALLEKEQQDSLETFSRQVGPGDELQGRVTRIEPYGAFVEVAPGLEGLVHISEMSWSRNLKPEEIVSSGDVVTVKLLSLEEQGKGRVRMNLSMKQAQADPWDDILKRFEPGSVVSGIITRTAPFGAFVELAPGIEGLVHISEMSYLKRIHKPEEEVSPGEQIRVKIKGIDVSEKRISLSIRDAMGDPWEGAALRFVKGKPIEGRVEKREEFGLLVRLEPGIVGLVPASSLARSQDKSLESKKPEDPVMVVVESVDEAARRITLAPADSLQTDDWKSFAPEAHGMGSLGLELKKAMEKKK
ncbi:S1 RNA-binding domain-containing protein [Desulfonatronovibrio hydrogenovorans]|uniref:S1 RNA-binding domain-containing protein n=1 Tax=Desulfonatronovibrio hydrogenovorans TaxID=53245 RepID=UPI00048DBC81|nr:S1 RNA-binding domain-containing protein [Desulfonatronovibrio hydrogenovorans]